MISRVADCGLAAPQALAVIEPIGSLPGPPPAHQPSMSSIAEAGAKEARALHPGWLYRFFVNGLFSPACYHADAAQTSCGP